jgi:molybdopterin-guanine dinucleotide biosynthesis protein A
VVLISVPFPGAAYGAFRIAQAIRQTDTSVVTVLGGGWANTELRELAEPRVFDHFDFVTLDAGERPLVALLEQGIEVHTGPEAGNELVACFRIFERDCRREPDWLAVAPCDLPALPIDAFARLARALDGAPAAFAVPDGQHHSLVCLLHRSLAPALRDALVAGRPRVSDWFGAVGAVPVRFADAAAFANLNTPADLAAAQASHG